MQFQRETAGFLVLIKLNVYPFLTRIPQNIEGHLQTQFKDIVKSDSKAMARLQCKPEFPFLQEKYLKILSAELHNQPCVPLINCGSIFHRGWTLSILRLSFSSQVAVTIANLVCLLPGRNAHIHFLIGLYFASECPRFFLHATHGSSVEYGACKYFIPF